MITVVAVRGTWILSDTPVMCVVQVGSYFLYGWMGDGHGIISAFIRAARWEGTL